MRTGTLWIGAAVLVLAAACNRNDTRSTNGYPDNDRQASNITLTGCLQPGEQGLAPNGAGARTSENVDRFVLANARTAASEPASSTDSSGPLYILEGKADELREHVSQQVQITGKLEDSSAAGNSRRVEVDSVRMISATCSQPSR